MQAAQISQRGGPEVIELVSLPDPEPGPGEVVVDVYAASVNAADWKVRAGSAMRVPDLPHGLGRDFSGVVTAAGAGARFTVGDSVFGVLPHGREEAYAEKVRVAADHVAAKPDDCSHVEAAAIGLAGLTAMVAIEETLDVRPGETVLIQGGAGGVGGMAVQFAAKIGAVVIATARSENHDYVASLGALWLIDYREEDVAKALGDCDAALDCVGQDTMAGTFAALKTGGRAAFIGVGADAPDPPRADLRSLRPDVYRSRERIDRLAAHINSGVIGPPQIEVLPFSEVRTAHAKSETGHVRGKLVLQIE